MIPALFPLPVQLELLNRLLHRDLSNTEHRTNVHLHYNVTYPGQEDGSVATSQFPSFFDDDGARVLHPKDPGAHRPITVQDFLDKKLRWITLGGQYDWTAKEYPAGRPPSFPEDISKLLGAIFPQVNAQAAIVNVYSSGDTLSVHRDVSEECDVGLVSVSFGCDGLFLISHDDGQGSEILRLRSGDTVYMDGPSRFAWHGVPKIMPFTCPSGLASWPRSPKSSSGDPKYSAWKGWMAAKRVNLNVRQMTNLSN